MKYKKDPWYIGGLITTLFSATVMVITMVCMYFGIDASIIWFFIMCAPFTAGILLCRTVINRYNDAEVSNGKPLPMFWRIRFGFHNLKVLVITRNLWRVIMTTLTAILLSATVVLGSICLYTLYTKSGAEKDPVFLRRNFIYEQCYDIWLRNRENKNDLQRNVSFSIMQDMHEKNDGNRRRIENCATRVKVLVPWILVTVGATAVSGIVTLSYVIYKKKKN